MSLWKERASNEVPGRVEITTGPAAELFLPFVFLLGLAIVLGPSAGIALLALGFALFAGAKVSMFRRGVWISLGSRAMSRPFRILYRLGYALMLFGAVAALGSLRLGRLPG